MGRFALELFEGPDAHRARPLRLPAARRAAGRGRGLADAARFTQKPHTRIGVVFPATRAGRGSSSWIAPTDRRWALPWPVTTTQEGAVVEVAPGRGSERRGDRRSGARKSRVARQWTDSSGNPSNSPEAKLAFPLDFSHVDEQPDLSAQIHRYLRSVSKVPLHRP